MQLIRLEEASDPRLHMTAALLAGWTSTAVTNPIWVIRTRLMTQTKNTWYQYNGIRDAFISVARNEGWRGFYKGLAPSMLGVVHVGIQFPLYESIKESLADWDSERSNKRRDYHSTLHILIASIISKSSASIITYPHEVIRTRMQNRPLQKKDTNAEPYGIWQVAKRLYKEDGGVSALYRGLGTNLLRVVPASAFTLLAYEMTIRFLRGGTV